MLEFQDGFFDQEIREGFYLDTTIKTLWAAEFELLQKIAEVCDKYGLQWYAAYGTLLGAVRHEGFVPWDDDMDIWLIRKDYNKLMQVLPKELPEGFQVRSPQTDEGYDQFHTCVNTGNGICIAKEWLEQFHGCPFTVGLDIFPLDYLPRDDEERELQENLFSLAGRIAQSAKNVARGDFDEQENRDELIEAIKEELMEGIEYLKENCKLPINEKLLEDENWHGLASEMWKWANHIAMMYEEEEGDYLVEYLDYIGNYNKKFPKEWFEPGYSAQFEDFMLPIPAGYTQTLRKIYWDYQYYTPKTGAHEYPYYARQLRQLKEYVKNVEERAEQVGLVSIDEIEPMDMPKEIPDEWLPIVTRADGSPKKIVLSANDVMLFVRYGEVALDKLEKRLESFERVKEEIALWWRPHPVMGSVLEQVSPECALRYQAILDKYKRASWGICDETDNTERAVEVCDVYYGDLNAIIQPFQNAEKLVMLAYWDGEYENDNCERFIEKKVYISYSDWIEKEGKIYFSNMNYNGLVIANKETACIEDIIPFEQEEETAAQLHCKCLERDGNILFLPVGSGCAHIYDMNSGEQKRYKLGEVENLEKVSWNFHCYGEDLFLLPCRQELGLWKWETGADAPQKEAWWQIASGESYLQHGKIDDERFYSLAVYANKLFITDVAKKTVQCLEMPDARLARIQYDGANFWYTTMETTDLICWSPNQGVLKRFEKLLDSIILNFLGLFWTGDKLLLISEDGEQIFYLDEEEGRLEHLHTLELSNCKFTTFDKVPHFKRIGNLLYVMYQCMKEYVVIDLTALEVKQYSQQFVLNQKQTDYQNNVLFERKVLLIEEPEEMDLNYLLRYCTSAELPWWENN